MPGGSVVVVARAQGSSTRRSCVHRLRSPRRAVRQHALSMLGRHPLRAADAAQLGAALLVARGGMGLPFVCLDTRLARAAEREGLRPIPHLE